MVYTLTRDTILDRLTICCAEISGIVKVYRRVPSIPMLDLPCIQLQGLDTQGTRTSEGWAKSTWTIAGLCVVCGINSMDTSEGYYPLELAEPFEDRIDDYFIQHPYLHTASLPELPFISALTINVSHAQEITRQGGNAYIGIPFQIILELDRPVR